MQVGDRIVSVGGQPVDGLSHSEVVAMLKNSYGNINLQVGLSGSPRIRTGTTSGHGEQTVQI